MKFRDPADIFSLRKPLTWGKGEHEFEVEGVELREQKDEDDAEDRQPPLQRRQRVPGELDPAVRTAARTTTISSTTYQIATKCRC